MDQNYVDWAFLLDRWEGEPKIVEPDKCSDLRYFAPDNLPEKCVTTLRAVAQAGFGDELTFSITNRENYEALMGEPFKT